MKNFKSLLTLIALASLGVASANAVQIKMGTQSGNIGFYRADPIGSFESILDNYVLGKSTDGTWFGTFCIEKNEYFTPGNTYDVAFNDGAVAGGRGGATNGKDVISKGTAWLYKQYATGAFGSAFYSTGGILGAMQKAIWFLEDEIGWGDLNDQSKVLLNDAGTALSLLPTATTLLPSDSAYWTQLKGDYTGNEVQVMNLTSNNGQNRHQDQLVYNPVPDSGSTLAFLGLAIFGTFAIRRRIR